MFGIECNVEIESIRDLSAAVLALDKFALKRSKSSMVKAVFEKSVAQSKDRLISAKLALENRNQPLLRVVSVPHDVSSELRSIRLTYIPETMPDDVRHRLVDIVRDLLTDISSELLLVALSGCPIYYNVNSEVSQKARKNKIIVVYVHREGQYFNPSPRHDVTDVSIYDDDNIMLIELSHLTLHLVKGQVQYVEIMYLSQQSIVFEHKLWQTLRENDLCRQKVMSAGFLKQALAQSLGVIGKKSGGRFVLRNDLTFAEFCQSIRLLFHVENILLQKGLIMSQSEVDLTKIPNVIENALINYQESFSSVVNQNVLDEGFQPWHKSLSDKITKHDSLKLYTDQLTNKSLRTWHAQCLKQCFTSGSFNPVLSERSSVLTAYLNSIPDLPKILHEDDVIIHLIVQAGSYLYNLNTKSSDTDYLIIFSYSQQNILESLGDLKEGFENRGPSKQIEFGCYEARNFAEMLLKGATVLLEVLFCDSDKYLYTSELFKCLLQQRDEFITENYIKQMLGLLKNNLRNLDSEKSVAKIRKICYQANHKLGQIESICCGESPRVTLTGESQTAIMQIREADFDNVDIRESYISQTKLKYESILDILSNRDTRLRENCDFTILINWLKRVRGFITH